MNHHLSTSLSASAASALHVLGAHVRSFAPSPRIVLGVAALASAGVLGVAGVGVASSHTSVMLEVNGVSRPVTSWGNTVGDALHAAGVSVGSNDLVQPGTGEAVRDGDTIVVRTSKPYTVTVDGQTRTLWTTASSADAILADAAPLGSAVSLAADRSSSRDELTPLVSRARNVVVTVDGTTREVAARPGQDARAILEASGVSVHPLDRVNVTTGEAGELSINVSRVTRGEATETVEIPFSETTTTSSDLFVGESQVTTAGVNGATTWTVWQEKKGDEVLTSVPITEHSTSQPVTQVRSEGTKEATPAALVAAGIDPKATLEEKVEADGTTSVRYRAKLGTISTKEEIAAMLPPPRAPSPPPTPVRTRVRWPSPSSQPRAGATASTSAWCSCGTASRSGTPTLRTPHRAPTASRSRCRDPRWPRPVLTGAPTRSPRSTGASATSRAATARPAPHGHTPTPWAGTKPES